MLCVPMIYHIFRTYSSSCDMDVPRGHPELCDHIWKQCTLSCWVDVQMIRPACLGKVDRTRTSLAEQNLNFPEQSGNSLVGVSRGLTVGRRNIGTRLQVQCVASRNSTRFSEGCTVAGWWQAELLRCLVKSLGILHAAGEAIQIR